jgi:hypothetical protein
VRLCALGKGTLGYCVGSVSFWVTERVLWVTVFVVVDRSL